MNKRTWSVMEKKKLIMATTNIQKDNRWKKNKQEIRKTKPQKRGLGSGE